ncbi:hypothetical protein CBM2623_A230023 [Cupriavidus taiwanensis]|nr:hypothetical protein CBM2608_A220024 [Cupriavidus taiwanensis]SPA27548.1 hypothetical protein CBM2623_A230023 [Cupriavidus taiwanensis]
MTELTVKLLIFRKTQSSQFRFFTGRLRRRHVLVHLPEAPAGGLPEDRRQFRARYAGRSGQPGDGGGDPAHRPRHGQADHCRIRRERGDARAPAKLGVDLAQGYHIAPPVPFAPEAGARPALALAG